MSSLWRAHDIDCCSSRAEAATKAEEDGIQRYRSTFRTSFFLWKKEAPMIVLECTGVHISPLRHFMKKPVFSAHPVSLQSKTSTSPGYKMERYSSTSKEPALFRYVVRLLTLSVMKSNFRRDIGTPHESSRWNRQEFVNIGLQMPFCSLGKRWSSWSS